MAEKRTLFAARMAAERTERKQRTEPTEHKERTEHKQRTERTEQTDKPQVLHPRVIEHDPLRNHRAASQPPRQSPGGFPAIAVHVRAIPSPPASNDEDTQRYPLQHEESLAAQIDAETANTILAMSHEERLSAHDEILASFSRETIEKFRLLARRKWQHQNWAQESVASTSAHPSHSAPVSSASSEPDPIPPPPEEQHKLEFWTRPIDASDNVSSLDHDSQSTSVTRFSLEGDVLDVDLDLPMHLGLHHHGEEPGRAGAVPSQRALATKILSCIIERVAADSYPPAYANPVSDALRAYMILVHVRAALDDMHVSVVLEGLRGVAAALSITDPGPAPQQLTSEYLYRATLAGHIAFEMSPSSLSEIGVKFAGVLAPATVDSLGAESEDDPAAQIFKDAAHALAETHILPRLQHLLATRKLTLPHDQARVLLILLRLAQHSVGLARAVADTPGLLATLRARFVAVAWPSPRGDVPRLAALALRVFGAVARACGMVREVLAAAGEAVRFLSFEELPDVGVDTRALRGEVFLFLGSVLECGGVDDAGAAGAGLFMDLRNEFVRIAFTLLKTVREWGHEEQVLENVWREVLAFWKMVGAAVKGAWVGEGGMTGSKAALMLNATLLDIFGKYLDMLKVDSPACKEFLEKLGHRDGSAVLPSVAFVRHALMVKSSPVAEKKSSFMFGVSRPNQDLFEAAVDRTIYANLIEASLMLDYRLSKLKHVLNVDMDECFIEAIASLPTEDSQDWTRIYARGINDLRASLLLKLADTVHPSKQVSTARAQTLVSQILSFMRNSLPTDADVFPKLFETLSLLHADFARAVPVALQILTQAFSLDTPAPNHHLIGFTKQSLPARPDWMYLALEYNITKESDVTVFLASTLRFIQTLERVAAEPDTFHPLKLTSLLKLYLLPPVGSALEEVYRMPGITAPLEALLDVYTSPGPTRRCASSLEAVCGGGTAFYKMYQELVAQFVATSFGDAAFARAMVVPLARDYPSDFRRLFWSEVPVQMLVGVGLETAMAPGGAGAYLGEAGETDLAVLDLYLGALVGGLAGKLGGGFFRDVAMHGETGGARHKLNAKKVDMQSPALASSISQSNTAFSSPRSQTPTTPGQFWQHVNQESFGLSLEGIRRIQSESTLRNGTDGADDFSETNERETFDGDFEAVRVTGTWGVQMGVGATREVSHVSVLEESERDEMPSLEPLSGLGSAAEESDELLSLFVGWHLSQAPHELSALAIEEDFRDSEEAADGYVGGEDWELAIAIAESFDSAFNTYNALNEERIDVRNRLKLLSVTSHLDSAVFLNAQVSFVDVANTEEDWRDDDSYGHGESVAEYADEFERRGSDP
ncbi:hypothetical protein BC830DRAFT_1086329 [Chytriomyces sp. MP71]|nr:hypothetical protein BC830DRAFT_1086329 [Chytriomyces sp. MP71]